MTKPRISLSTFWQDKSSPDRSTPLSSQGFQQLADPRRIDMLTWNLVSRRFRALACQLICGALSGLQLRLKLAQLADFGNLLT